MPILPLISLIILSIFLISKGSDWLTDSLVPIAKKLKTSNVSVGLILVSVVVSLPEILVALDSSLRGYQEISLGVIFGSIICNIGLMTGLSAFIRPLTVTKSMVLRDGIFSIIVPILIFAIGSNGQITRIEGFAIFLLFIPYLINVFLQEKRAGSLDEKRTKRDIVIELKLIGLDFGHIQAGWISFSLGLILLLSGTYLFSDQLVRMVEIFNIHPFLIGISLGALVPSIPNIAASFKATQIGLTEVAVSETIGANIFTLLVTIGIISMIAPISIDKQLLTFDLPVMIIMSFILFVFMSSGNKISKKEGAVLLSSYLMIIFIQIVLS